MVMAQDGMIIDTILNALSGLVEKSNNVVFSAVMYVVQSLLTLLVPSSSGLAALSMPIMAPLCDLHGVNPEAAVTALQYGNQLTNLMSPVAGTTVAGLAICKISFGQWWKTTAEVYNGSIRQKLHTLSNVRHEDRFLTDTETCQDSNTSVFYFRYHPLLYLPNFPPIFHATFFQLLYYYKVSLTFFCPPVFIW